MKGLLALYIHLSASCSEETVHCVWPNYLLISYTLYYLLWTQSRTEGWNSQATVQDANLCGAISVTGVTEHF